MADRTAWRICSDNGWWSAFGKKKRGKGKKVGPPVHDDLVQRNFTAGAANELWLTDITEHWTGEGKLYVCAIKDVYSNRIVGYSIDSRMKSRLAVTALNNAVARRGDVASCIDRLNSPNFAAESSSAPSAVTRWSAPWAESAPPATTPPCVGPAQRDRAAITGRGHRALGQGQSISFQEGHADLEEQ